MAETEREIIGLNDPLVEGDGIEMARYDTHCETEGCPNGEFTYRVSAMAEGPVVICGGCDIPVADVVRVQEGSNE